MRNCLFCHRPISGEAYEFLRVKPLLLGQVSPSTDTSYELQYAHVECLENAERCFIEPDARSSTEAFYRKFMRERGL